MLETVQKMIGATQLSAFDKSVTHIICGSNEIQQGK